MNESETEPTNTSGSMKRLLQQVSSREGDVGINTDLPYARIETRFRMMAKRLLRGHRADRSPAETGVIDKIFLKLIEPNKFNWINRRHFLRTASVSMRRYVANHYRNLDALKRRIDRDAILLGGAILADVNVRSPSQIVELSDQSGRLLESHSKAMEALDLWAFSGWTQEEVAGIIESPPCPVPQLISLAKQLVEKAIQDE
ncbi:ECF-type sigma factor [Novipirellula herctigrandis]